MGTERRREVLFTALAVVLAVIAYRAYRVGLPTAAAPVPASNARGAAPPSARAAPPAVTAPAVHLDALEEARPTPEEGQRNLFRFKPKAPPPPPPTPPRPTPTAPASPAPTGALQPPPPIAFKFIGIVEAPESQKIAVLSDTRGNVFHGREGDIIEGRYRIVRIGVESIEMIYLDGRGRQTIRLSGS